LGSTTETKSLLLWDIVDVLDQHVAVESFKSILLESISSLIGPELRTITIKSCYCNFVLEIFLFCKFWLPYGNCSLKKEGKNLWLTHQHYSKLVKQSG